VSLCLCEFGLKRWPLGYDCRREAPECDHFAFTFGPGGGNYPRGGKSLPKLTRTVLSEVEYRGFPLSKPLRIRRQSPADAEIGRVKGAGLPPIQPEKGADCCLDGLKAIVFGGCWPITRSGRLAQPVRKRKFRPLWRAQLIHAGARAGAITRTRQNGSLSVRGLGAA
jgi:hypothetical protein